ncbi:MAG: cytochrome C oxidase subunit IV family protein [Acidobacteriota bacterium]
MPYIVVLLALWVLTVVTWAVALVDLGEPWADIVALTIAMFKASLVVAYFMHVKDGTPLIKIVAIAGVVWLVLFFGFVFGDYFVRIIDWVVGSVTT